MDGERGTFFPDAEITVRDPESDEDVTLTVREFRFREALHARVMARPLIEALAGEETTDDEMRDALSILEILADHAETWVALIALASGRPAEWIAGLSEADGTALGHAMWDANGGFLSRCIAITAHKMKESQ